uniref:SLC12 domain-containing protein n=1 Tax=Schistocephalus solidus TaxID=70667 RepID=A0A183S8S7_SCHSO
LLGFYGQLLRTLNLTNVAGYIDAYINRTDLGLVRCLDLPSIVEQREKQAGTNAGPPTAIKVSCCLVTGARAQELARALSDLNGRMDPRKTQFLIVPDCTGFLMEENPDKLALNFLHFLRTEGLEATIGILVLTLGLVCSNAPLPLATHYDLLSVVRTTSELPKQPLGQLSQSQVQQTAIDRSSGQELSQDILCTHAHITLVNGRERAHAECLPRVGASDHYRVSVQNTQPLPIFPYSFYAEQGVAIVGV